MTNQEYIKIPLEIDVLQSVLKSKDIFLNIDYNKSKPLRNNGFLSYISNLGIQCSININDIDEIELEELLLCFMTTRQLVICDDLTVLLCVVILKFMGIDSDGIHNFTITDKFFDRFIQKNNELLMKYYIFISSLLTYTSKIIEENNDISVSFKNYEGFITDGAWVGTNVVTLFEIESFFELFFSRKELDYPQFYFTIQFDEMVFNALPLHHYFIKDDRKNWILTAMSKEYHERSNPNT